MRIQLLPVLSPIVPIFALQIPEFLLGLHPLGEISCRGLYSVLAPVSSKCRSSAPELKFPFWNSNLLCAIHLSVSCIPDIFPCCRGGLPFFLISRDSQSQFCSLLSLSWWYLKWTPSHLARYQEREGNKSLFCAPNYHKMQWQS